MALYLILFVVAFVLAGACAVVAHRRSRDSWSGALAFVLKLGGVFALYYGLIALALNGYVEDSGMPPSRTLGTALPVLALAVATCAAAWMVTLRPQARA